MFAGGESTADGLYVVLEAHAAVRGQWRQLRINEPQQVKGGGVIARALPFWKWRRPDGLATMVRDLIALRKTLVLCHACERKMPRRWTEKYDYAFVKGFHAEGSACDYCRALTSANMYCAVDGAYHQAMERMSRSIEETRARERALYEKDRRYFLGVS